MFFTLDVQGALALKEKYPNYVLIYLIPPSLLELRKRLQKRKTDSLQVIQLRLKEALREISFWHKYDYVVVNQDLKKSVAIIQSIIQAEKCRTKNFDFLKRGQLLTN